MKKERRDELLRLVKNFAENQDGILGAVFERRASQVFSAEACSRFEEFLQKRTEKVQRSAEASAEFQQLPGKVQPRLEQVHRQVKAELIISI